MSQDRIIKVQEIANNSWQAKEFYLLNGWVLRFNEGATGRANSVLPLNYWGNDLLGDIRLVELAYKHHNLPARWQLHDGFVPERLFEVLKSEGYKQDPRVDVMGTDLQTFNRSDRRTTPLFTLSASCRRTKAWTRAFIELTTHRDRDELGKMCEIMDRITIPRKQFLVAHGDDQVAGVIFGVVDRSFLGIMDLVVAPHYRRKGLATALVTNTVNWASQHSARSLYLQVLADNDAAIALYQKLGLNRWFSYFYLTQT